MTEKQNLIEEQRERISRGGRRMTEKELEKKANKKSLSYNAEYSEDATLKDMLSRPQSFVECAIEGIVNLLRQKAYRDGYIAGYIDAQNGIKEEL